MCEYSLFTKITSTVISIIIVLIPIIYLLKKINRKNKVKVLLTSLVICFMLIGIKHIFKLNIDKFRCINCIVNYKCKDKELINTFKEDKNKKTNKNEKKEDTTNKTSKGFIIYEEDGVTYIDGYMIVNKTYSLPENFIPKNTYTDASKHNDQQCASCIDKDAYKAYKEMKADALALNLNIYISSGYRSYKVQNNIYSRNVKKNGKDNADTYSARPGNSEHQSGLCFDLNTIDSSFQYTEEGKWINNNAYKYGYIIRYPKGKTDETGYIYEPWHLRYVGKELAEKLYNNGNWITMEEYFGITSKYND